MSGAAPAWVSAGCTVAVALIGCGVIIAKLDNVEGDVVELKASVANIFTRMDAKMDDRFRGSDHRRFVTDHHEPLHVELQTVRERVVALEANH